MFGIATDDYKLAENTRKCFMQIEICFDIVQNRIYTNETFSATTKNKTEIKKTPKICVFICFISNNPTPNVRVNTTNA